MSPPTTSRTATASATRGPAWLRAIGVALLLVGAGAVIHAVRVGYAAWLVFPAPELEPSLERAVGAGPTALARLERVTSLVPGDARYWHLRAEAERRRAHDLWFDPRADSLLERARADAEKAVALVPTNPYHRELAADLLLDAARRQGGSSELVGDAVQRLREALQRAPGSPVIAQRVGLDLVRAWDLIGEDARTLAADSIRRAATWHGAYLRPAYETIAAHLPLGEAAVLAGEVTPATPDGASRLDEFLRRVADRVPAGSEQRRSIGPAVVDAGAELLERSGYPPAAMLDWALWGVSTFPEQRTHMTDTVRSIQQARPEAPGPPLALTALVEESEERLALADEAVQLAGDDGDARRIALERQGAVLEEEGRLEDALAVYRHLASLAPDRAGPLLDAARILQSLRRPGEALETLETATSRDPLSLEARRRLGAAYLEASQFQRAIDTWRYVVQRAPRDAATRLQLAKVYEQLGRIDDAERYYEAAASLDPGLRPELERFQARVSGPGR